VSKYTIAERQTVKSIVATLSIKRIPESEIINEVYKQTNKRISRSGLWRVRQQIKRESYQWYETLRKDNFEYIHEFRERINEIIDLQKMHHKISLAELHHLNITLSNYFDIAPTIVNIQRNDNSISIPQQDKEIIV
jgi:hypothetical protein